MKNILLIISISLNFVLVFYLIYKILDGCAEIPNGKLGMLNRDVEIGHFGSNKKLFKLPKGLIVKDASATGMDWFEPHRFRIIITSEDKNLVNYNINLKSLEGQSEYYSAEIGNK